MNLLRSKFSDYRDFHTLLYICAKEFDFLVGSETFLALANFFAFIYLFLLCMSGRN